jgi:hypothetical protein
MPMAMRKLDMAVTVSIRRNAIDGSVDVIDDDEVPNQVMRAIAPRGIHTEVQTRTLPG